MTTINLSPHQVKELRKCKRSVEYFADTYCWIQQKASAGVADRSATIPFVMGKRAATKDEIDSRHVPDEAQFFFQRRIIRWLQQKKNVTTLKSRRVGCSWAASIYVAWLINFHEGVSVAFISETGEKAKDILDKVQFILKNLALHDSDNINKATKCLWLRGKLVSDNETKVQIAWHNDAGEITSLSSVTSLTNTDDSARSGDYTFIVFDELDFYEHPDITWASAQPSLLRGGHWLAISTPGEIGQIFHRMCSQGDLWLDGLLSSEEKPDFEYIRIHWSEAGITPDDIKRQTVGYTSELVDKEWEWRWIVPGMVAFDPTHLAVCFKPPEQYPEVAEELAKYAAMVRAYRENIPNTPQVYYYSGADTAKGNPSKKSREKDWHAFVAMTKSGIQAYEYTSQEPLSSWAGKTIDGPTGTGKIVVSGKLSQLHVDWPGYLQIEEEGPGYTAYNNHQVPGDHFSTYAPVAMKHKFKKGAVERLIIKVETHQIVITSRRMYQQLSMIQKGSLPGTYAAPSGYNDDLFVALVLAEDARDQEGGMEFSFGASAASPQRASDVAGEEIANLPSGPLIQLPVKYQTETSLILDGLGDLPRPESDAWFRARAGEVS